jgi:Lon protease-like protein
LHSKERPTGIDDLSNESPEERAERMKLVRQIQATFYNNDDEDDDIQLVSTRKQQQSNNDNDNSLSTSSSILLNVPLFRVQWTELIGYQNMLNIHEPHYTHMFRRIISQPSSQKWRYGHVYLPNGSKNLNNPEFKYDNPNNKATYIGTLMQISDVVDVEEDGRLGLIVQAIERFEIVNVTQQIPYTMATIRLLPEDEFTYSLSKTLSSPSISTTTTTALQELEKWYEWENYPTKYSECSIQRGYPQVSPLVNYNCNFFTDEITVGGASNNIMENIEKGISQNNNNDDDDVASDAKLVTIMEYRVWCSLDKLLTTLGEVSGLNIPVPSQLLVLLPIHPPEEWPENFRIEKIAKELQARNVDVGTYTKSPFLRVAENLNYPPLRRARRLSYAIWILLDTILGPAAPNCQSLLECETITERLSGAAEQLEDITRALQEKRT